MQLWNNVIHVYSYEAVYSVSRFRMQAQQLQPQRGPIGSVASPSHDTVTWASISGLRGDPVVSTTSVGTG